MKSRPVEMKDRFWFIATSMVLGKLSKKRAHLTKEDEYATIKTLYERMGGSWQALAEGCVESWQNLRTCCKVYLKYCKEKKIGPFDPERQET